MYNLIVFIAGMAVMMLEVAGIRIMIPYFGSGSIVSTSMIGVVLASLSLGYFWGGKLSDKNPSLAKLSLYIFFAGIFCLITSFSQFKIFEFISNIQNINIFLKVVISSIIVYTIPSILLAFVSPYIIKIALINKNQETNDTGKVVGKLYAFSTLGSILGTFLCGFYLILYFGMEIISFIITSIIFICSFLCFLSNCNTQINKKMNLLLITNFIFLILICFFLATYYKVNNFKIIKSSIYTRTSPYQFLSVNKHYTKKGVLLTLNNVIQPEIVHSMAYINDNYEDRLLFGYLKVFYSFFKEKQKKNNILLVGNGAGIFLSALNDYKEKTSQKNIIIDVVEIDKFITEIATKFFDMKVDNNTNIYHQDAKVFINQKLKDSFNLYDLIFLDVYMDSFLIPYNIITKESMMKLYSLLAEDGILLINVIGGEEEPYKSNLNQVYTQVSDTFKNVYVYLNNKNNVEDSKVYNYVIAAYKNLNNENLKKIKQSISQYEYKNCEKTDIVYTDTYMPYERLLFSKKKTVN